MASHPQTLLHNPTNGVNQTTQDNTMKKFQEFIIKLAETQPNAPLAPATKTLLEGRLNQFVAEYKTPDHPPYSAMIEDALQKLNEKQGSSEESISQYLEKEYDNLPWGHSALLKHHLQELCESGDIVVTHNKRYGLAGCLDLSTEVKEKRPRRECRLSWEREEKVRRKKRSRKKRNRQKGGKAEIKRQQEYDEKEKRVTENGVHSEVKHGRSLSLVDGENGVCSNATLLLAEPPGLTAADETKYSDAVRSQVRADILALDTQEQNKREQSEYNQTKISSPKSSPGYELIGVKKLPHSMSRELELPLAEEFVGSKRKLRQLKLWSSSPGPKAVTLTSLKLGTSSKSEATETSQDRQEAFDSAPFNVELLHHEQKQSKDDVELVQSAMHDTKLKRDERYGRRRKNKAKKSGAIGIHASPNPDHPTEIQNERPFEPYTTIDSPILYVDLNQEEIALSNEQEFKEMLEKPPSRRSSRARPAKPKPDDAADLKTVDCPLCEKMAPRRAKVVIRNRRGGRPPRPSS